MEFWVLWFIGIVITIGTRIVINKLAARTYSEIIEYSSIPEWVITNLLVIICIVLVGGIAGGSLLYLDIFIVKEDGKWMFFILSMALIYSVGHLVLGLHHFSGILSQICFIVVFIISTIEWSIPIRNYNLNIETITETQSSTQEKKLLYFCNIPVQEISGSISGSSFGIYGDISTSDEFSYWYANESNEGIYDSVPANSSKIVFISDEEKPYLEIVSYTTYTKTINHNNGKEDSRTDKEWKEYIFYLPEEIIQYSLD